MKTSHKLDVKRFKRMACWLDKVDTRVDAIIDDVCAVRFILCFEVGVESAFDAF